MKNNCAEILNLFADEISTKVKQREIAAVEVVESYINQIEKVNPLINAIIQHDFDAAFKTAKHIDANISDYQDKPLVAVPVTVKNFCDVMGFKPDKGCAALIGRASIRDATAVARMREAGAIVMGLTNTPEFSIGYETDNLVYGQTKNPYNFKFTPGGSSGGEAAAIAAQCSLMGLGSDLSGSLRIPAHFSGITCLKMTQGRVPFTGSIPSDHTGLFSQFISCGPMARSVSDLMLLSSTIVGSDGIDPHTAPVLWNNPNAVDLSKIRVAYYDSDELSEPTENIKNVIKSAAEALMTECKSVENTQPDCVHQLGSLFEKNIFLGGDKGKWLKNIIEQIHLSEPSPLLKEFMFQAETSEFSVTELRGFWTELDIFRKSLLKFFQQYDVIICPVAATCAKLHGTTFAEIADFSYSICYSMLSCPAAVVRCGSSCDGMPIGVQIIAAPWREDHVLKVAATLENKLGGWQPAKIAEP